MCYFGDVSADEQSYVDVNRAHWTTANSRFTDARAADSWAETEVSWGVWHLPESGVGALPDVRGLDVIELGCGTGYFGAWLKRLGARRVVGVDITPAQLEAARLLRPNGELVFLSTSPLVSLCSPDSGPTVTKELQRPQQGLHRLDWHDEEPCTEFALGHGEMFRLLQAQGFTVVDLIELYAPPDVVDHSYHSYVPAAWATKWPAEDIWRARKNPG
jgi:SAM-dependent methyltransferase